MCRIAIIGSGGAGKSTLAKQLHAVTGLPLIHLDAHFWRPGWVQAPREEWEQTASHIFSQEQWITDGNFSSGWDKRFSRADTIVFMDTPRWLCFYRVFVRQITRRRADEIPGCREKFDWEFYKWIWSYPRKRPAILARLRTLGDGTRIIHLRSKKDAASFIASVRR